jgi:hypothetical protein
MGRGEGKRDQDAEKGSPGAWSELFSLLTLASGLGDGNRNGNRNGERRSPGPALPFPDFPSPNRIPIPGPGPGPGDWVRGGEREEAPGPGPCPFRVLSCCRVLGSWVLGP